MNLTLFSPYDPEPGPGSSADAHVGGVERVFQNVSQRLVRRGHGVTLICSSDEDSEHRSPSGVNVVRVRRRGTLLRAPLAPLERHLPSDADLVHVAATYPFTTPAILRRARALSIPSVLDFHFEPHPEGWFGRAAATLYRRIGPPSYRLAKLVLVRSRAYGRSSPSLLGVPEDSWRIVPNGVDPSRFHAQGTTPGEYLLFVGRLVPYKGLDVLIRALAQRPPGLPLLIAGDGPSRSSLESLARRLRVDARFLGHVPEEALPGLYRGARLTVLPSVNSQEAFGICLIESMACGTPILASELPGVSEVAAFGGLVAPPGDVDAWAFQVRRAMLPGALARGAPLAKRAHAAFSWDAVTDRVLEVYHEVVGAGTAAGLAAAPRGQAA